MNEKEKILQDIRRVTNEIAPEPLTSRSFAKLGSFSLSKLRYHYGSFNNAVLAAGYAPNNPHIAPIPRPLLDNDELLTEIGRVWNQIGKRPTESAFNATGKYSVRPYKKRWGTFGRAVDLYIARFGEPNTLQGVNASDHYSSQSRGSNQGTGQSVIIPPTHKPSTKSRRERVLYGEPMDFRGLRYAPINEQGVVYLFGMVSRELGFLIESVRTEFPDCEGKRATDKAGTHWEHVRIEFEFKSKNFFEHGHDPDSCDLIVCWLHNWKECPLEVLELRSSIPLLAK